MKLARKLSFSSNLILVLIGKKVILLAGILSLFGCTMASNQTGFLKHHSTFSPIKGVEYEKRPDIVFDNPENSTIIIYSHGTTSSLNKEDCSKSVNNVPDSILALEEELETYVFYLCSDIGGPGAPGSYVVKRSYEIKKTIENFLSLGVKPKNIFIAGQSAGGWSSLLLMDYVDVLFNAAIVTAPAMAGKRKTRDLRWSQARSRQIKRMMDYKKIDSLVFAYYGDPYEQPEDLQFLTDSFPETVKMIAYSCGYGDAHGTAQYDCLEYKTIKIIKEYINQQRNSFPS